MSDKNIIVIGALAAGAYLLLGSGGLGGGAEGGGGGKKATAITGVTPGSDPGGSMPDNTAPTNDTRFQPSKYLMDLITMKYNPAPSQGSGGKVIISTPGSPAPLADQFITQRAISGAYGQSGIFVIPGGFDAFSKKNTNSIIPNNALTQRWDAGTPTSSIAPMASNAPAYSAIALSISTLTTPSKKTASAPAAPAPVLQARQSQNNTAPVYKSGKFGGWG